MTNWYIGAENQKTTLTFNFNEEAVREAGLTTDELLEDMRRYAEECEIDEIAHGVFEKKGIHAMAILYGYVVRKDEADPDFINYLHSWIADAGGEREDCKLTILECRK